MKLSDLIWSEASKYIDNINNHLIVPFSTCEQHGYYLPLENDTLVVEHIAKMLFDDILPLLDIYLETLALLLILPRKKANLS